MSCDPSNIQSSSCRDVATVRSSRRISETRAFLHSTGLSHCLSKMASRKPHRHTAALVKKSTHVSVVEGMGLSSRAGAGEENRTLPPDSISKSPQNRIRGRAPSDDQDMGRLHIMFIVGLKLPSSSDRVISIFFNLI